MKPEWFSEKNPYGLMGLGGLHRRSFRICDKGSSVNFETAHLSLFRHVILLSRNEFYLKVQSFLVLQGHPFFPLEEDQRQPQLLSGISCSMAGVEKNKTGEEESDICHKEVDTDTDANG